MALVKTLGEFEKCVDKNIDKAKESLCLWDSYRYALLPNGDVEKHSYVGFDVDGKTVCELRTDTLPDEEIEELWKVREDLIYRMMDIALDKAVESFKELTGRDVDNYEWDEDLEDVYIYSKGKKFVIKNVCSYPEHKGGGQGISSTYCYLKHTKKDIVELED